MLKHTVPICLLRSQAACDGHLTTGYAAGAHLSSAIAIVTADNIGHICMYTWLSMFNKVNINALIVTVEPIGLRG